MARPRYNNTKELFLEDIKIRRHILESCEFEVSIDAMSKYILCYPFYRSWQLEFRGNNVKLVRDNYYLDADIVTSRKSLEKRVEGKGCERICDMFREVYYSLGNMMPVMGNCKAGSEDNWMYKMKFIHEIFEKDPLTISKEKLEAYQKGDISFRCTSQRELWPAWIRGCWKNDKEKFIADNFLYDIYSDDVNDYKDYENQEQFLIDTIKIIIQRSYRILQNKSGEFTVYDKKVIVDIFDWLSEKYDMNKILGNEIFSLKNKNS